MPVQIPRSISQISNPNPTGKARARTRVLRDKVTPIANQSALEEYHRLATYASNAHTSKKLKRGGKGSKDTTGRNGYVLLPRWVTELLPAAERRATITAAILLGARTDGHKIKMGQLRLRTKRYFRYIPAFTDAEFADIWTFGRAANLVSLPSILRTALAVGIKLVGCYTGKVLPSIKRPVLSTDEWTTLLREAGVCPTHPALIPNIELYMKPRWVGDFTTINA